MNYTTKFVKENNEILKIGYIRYGIIMIQLWSNR